MSLHRATPGCFPWHSKAHTYITHSSPPLSRSPCTLETFLSALDSLLHWHTGHSGRKGPVLPWSHHLFSPAGERILRDISLDWLKRLLWDKGWTHGATQNHFFSSQGHTCWFSIRARPAPHTWRKWAQWALLSTMRQVMCWVAAPTDKL